MSTTWNVFCKDCAAVVTYSESSRQDALNRGQSPPERCVNCRRAHRRQTSRLGFAYVDLEPGKALPVGGLKASRLGRIEREARPHGHQSVEPDPIRDDQFGIKDKHVAALLGGLVKHQVAIVQAGTGSGKSTFLPYRLMVPPAPYPHDHLTRHGQILVTQPRIDASTGIPTYVAERLHGSATGPGLDIGYRNSKATDKSDAANKLVYLTDGTLVNMIRKGELHNVSTIVIDEAHERSLNIDLILALLRREMRNHPQLRLLIVSATLDKDTFTEFFSPDYDVLYCPMPGKAIHPVHERWRTGEPIPVSSWPRQMPDEVARTAIEVLRWMELGERPDDIPTDVPTHLGDLLCFLPGKRPIAQAIAKIEELLTGDEELRNLAGKVEILPLHSELPGALRRKPLDPHTRRKSTKYRVIVSTNLAETSLTIDGIRHVIDSGLNNLTSWDPATAAADMKPAPHSRSGLLQRRGRAGRNAPGVWHCLFTREQFDALEYETAPEIARAPLSAVLLNASAAGISDPADLKWMPPGPSPAELLRVRAQLVALGAVTEQGDPTEFGHEVNASRAEFSDTTVLINADIAGCVVEAATVLAMKAQTLDTGALLRWSRNWPAEAKLHVDDVHSTLLHGCQDDLEAICRIVSYWEQQPDTAARRAWCERHYIDPGALRTALDERAKLLTSLQSRMKTEDVRPIDLALLPRLRAVIAWSHPNGIYRTRPQDGTTALLPVRVPRSDAAVIDAMSQGVLPVVDPRSWASRNPPEHLVLLDRSRHTQWTSPLEDPCAVQQGALCAAVDPSVLDGASSLLSVLARVGLGERTSPPEYLPGDRVRAWVDGQIAQAVEVLDGIPDPTVELGGDQDDDVPDERTPRSSETAYAASTPLQPGDEADVYISPFDDTHEEAPTDQPLHRTEESNRPTSDQRTEPRARQRDTGIRRPAPVTRSFPAMGLVDIHRVGEPRTAVVRVTSIAGDTILAALEADADEFTTFTERHAVGSELVVRVEEVRTFPRDRRPVIVASDRQSRSRVVLDSGMLGTGMRHVQAELLSRGTEIRLGVDGYDYDRRVRYLSQTATTIGALASLRARTTTGQRFATATATVVDADDRRMWVQLIRDDVSLPQTDQPPLVFAVSAAYLPETAGLRIGTTIRVRLTWGRRASHQHVPGLADQPRVPQGPWELHDETIVLTAPPAVADWQRLVHHADQRLRDSPEVAARLRNAVLWASRRMLTPRVEIIDHAAIERLRDDRRALATVVAADDRSVVVKLPHGGTQSIPSWALTWGDEEPPAYRAGDRVTAYIISADPTTGEVRAELRDPDENPYLRLHVGDQREALVTGHSQHDERDLIVRLAGTSLDARLRGREAAGAQVGQTIQVRLIEVDPQRRRVDVSAWIYDETVILPSRLEELWASPAGSAPRRKALERAVPEGTQLWTSPNANGGLDVRVRSSNEATGRRAVARLSQLATCALAYIAIPGTDTVRADDSELLRRLGPEVVAATTRRKQGSRTIAALAVAASSPDAITKALFTLQRAHPYQWVSEPFGYDKSLMETARTALRESGIDAWLNIEAMPGQRPRAVITGRPQAVEQAAVLLRRHGINVPSEGAWRVDKRIAIVS